MRALKITKSITSREDSIDKYLYEIGKEDLITVQEEIELAQKIRQGDQKALERLTKANLRFVVSVAKQYQNQGISLPDLINDGNLGLIKAAQRFDETRGFKFISYAVWWIRQSILKALADESRIVRVPTNQNITITKINTAFSQFQQTHSAEPTSYQIGEILSINSSHIDNLISIQQVQSLDSPLNADDGGSGSGLLEMISDPNAPSTDQKMLTDSLKHDILVALSILTPFQKEIIELHYGLNGRSVHSEKEIAEKFDVAVSKIKNEKLKAFRILKYNKKIMKALGQHL